MLLLLHNHFGFPLSAIIPYGVRCCGVVQCPFLRNAWLRIHQSLLWPNCWDTPLAAQGQKHQICQQKTVRTFSFSASILNSSQIVPWANQSWNCAGKRGGCTSRFECASVLQGDLSMSRVCWRFKWFKIFVYYILSIVSFEDLWSIGQAELCTHRYSFAMFAIQVKIFVVHACHSFAPWKYSA